MVRGQQKQGISHFADGAISEPGKNNRADNNRTETNRTENNNQTLLQRAVGLCLSVVKLPNPCGRKPQLEQDTESQTKRFSNFIHTFSDSLKDIGFVCLAVPYTLLRSNPADFCVSLVSKILKGAHGAALTWAGSVFASLALSGGKLGAEFILPCSITLAATHFSGRALSGISTYQLTSETVGIRRHCIQRLIWGIVGQRLDQAGDERLAQSASLARNNHWVPHNLGYFYYPIVQQASSFFFIGATVALQAPAHILTLALCMTLPYVLSTFVSTHLNTAHEKKHAKSNNKANRLAEYLTSVEYLRGIKIDQIATTLFKSREEHAGQAERAERGRGRVVFYMDSMSGVLYATCLFSSLYQIGHAAVSGAMDPTRALLLSGAVVQLSDAVSNFVSGFIRLRLAAPYLRALRDIERSVDLPPAEYQSRIPDSVIPGLKLSNLTVQRAKNQPLLLSNVSHVIESGKITVLFGPQGCGKTTLFDFLAGLRQPNDKSEISAIIGEELVPLADIHQYEWIRSIGFCSQHPEVYSTISLIDNIRCGVDISEEKKAESDPLILKLLEIVGKSEWEKRLDQVVGEEVEGVGFSGGERQLIAIMRALYKRPKLLFLDEAFTNLPQHLTERLLKCVGDLKDIIGWQPTVVMITHDARHNLYADQVVLLSEEEHGIVGFGTHDALNLQFEGYRREASALKGR